jgi:hypothetical protein
VSLDRRIVEQAWGHKQTRRVVAHATARDEGPTLSFAAGKRAVRWRPEAIIRNQWPDVRFPPIADIHK